jgi:hypothetical protein
MQPQQEEPQSPVEQWHQVLGGLNQGYSQLDAPGQARVNDLNMKTESLMAQKTRLRPDEFAMAMKSVHDSAVDYPWDRHTKPPGSNPGDLVEEDGVMKLTEADGNRRPVAYTPEYMAKNSMPIGSTGKVAIPVSPDKPYEIVDAAQRDIAGERGEIDKARKGIEKIYTEIAKEMAKTDEKVVRDKDGKEVGTLPFTREERRRMSIMAKDAYIKDEMQAKHAAKVVADAGTHQLEQAIGGDVADPYQTEQNVHDMQREAVNMRIARKEAAGELMAEQGMQPEPQGMPPTPSPSPGRADGTPPGMPPKPDAAMAGVDPALAAALGGDDDSPEARAEKSLQYQAVMQAKQAVADAPDFESRLVQAGTMRAPMSAPDKATMNEEFAEAPDGITVQLPDGRRYIKDEGKFWQVPWSKEQLQSDTMLDAEGEEIIDPNTGEAAPGIVKQLEAGKSQMMGGQALTDEEAGAAHAAGNQIPVGREQAGRLNAGTPITEGMSGEQMLNAQKAADDRQARIGAQKLQSGAPGRPEAVDPERTAEAAEGVDPARLPNPDESQPELATQEAIQARTQQAGEAAQKTSPQAVQAQFNEVVQADYPKSIDKLRKPRRIKPGESLDAVEPGEAIVTQSGQIFLRFDDGSWGGPFTQEMVKQYDKSRAPKKRPYSPLYG